MRRFRDLSIKRKLMLIILLTSCLALLVACVAFILHARVTYRIALSNDRATLAEIIAANSTAALAFDDPIAAEEMLATLQAKPDGVAGLLRAA